MRRAFLVFAFGWFVVIGAARGRTVAYWRFEEGSANSPANGDFAVLDSSGNGLDGTPINGPVYRADVPAATVPFSGAPDTRSLQFNGTSQRVTVPDNPKFVLTHSLTLEAFIKPLAATDLGQIVFRGDDRPGNDAYWLYVQNNQVIFDIENAAQQFAYVTAPLPGLNRWMEVAGTLDDATGAMRLYINGSQRAAAVTSIRPVGPMDPNSNPGIGIGNVASGNYNEYFNGLIDEVRISDQALVPTQFLSAGSMPGDANRDGKVDFSDLLVLAQHYGMNTLATWTDGDFNGDGSVGFDDVLILAQHYGQPLSAAQQAQLSPAFAADVRSAFPSVPEPGAASCLVPGLLLVAGRSRERNRQRRRPPPQKRNGAGSLNFLR